MNTDLVDNLIRQASSSLAIRFGTTEPYAIGRTDLLSKGFGTGVQFVAVAVDCPERAISALVPIARQVVASYLGEHGYDLEAVMIRPTVMSRTWYFGGRETGLFENENESASCGLGARKRGGRYWFAFEIVAGHPIRRAISWPGTLGQWKEV